MGFAHGLCIMTGIGENKYFMGVLRRCSMDKVFVVKAVFRLIEARSKMSGRG